MLKRIKVVLIATIMFFTGFAAFMPAKLNSEVKAEEVKPVVSIYAKNLIFVETVYIKYAVQVSNVLETDELGLLIWTEAPDEYTYGTHDTKLSATYEEVNGTTMPTFTYTKLAAKQMTDVLYAVAYVERGGVYYYSAPKKYSILEYAYNKLGKTDAEPTTNTELQDLLEGMLIYGGSAQKYFDYKLDQLASDEHYYVKVENGLLEDGFSYGLFTDNQQAVVTANDKVNMEFSHWEDEYGNVLSYEKTYAYTPSDSITLIAIYDDFESPNEPDAPNEPAIKKNHLSFNYEKTQTSTVATLSLSGDVKMCGFQMTITCQTKGAEFDSVTALKIGSDAIDCSVLQDGNILMFYYNSQLADVEEATDLIQIVFNNTQNTVEINFTINVEVFVDSSFNNQEYTISKTSFKG